MICTKSITRLLKQIKHARKEENRMNKVFAEVNKRIDEALTTHQAIIQAKETELAKYDQLAKEAQEKADQLLFEGKLDEFRKLNQEAIEYQTAAEKIRDHMDNTAQAIMNEKDAAALEKKIQDELGKLNDKYSKEIYKHLLEVERLANELNDLMGEGDQADKRFRFEILHQSQLVSVVNLYNPNIRQLVSALRKLPYLQRMKGNRYTSWPMQIGR